MMIEKDSRTMYNTSQACVVLAKHMKKEQMALLFDESTNDSKLSLNNQVTWMVLE